MVSKLKFSLFSAFLLILSSCGTGSFTSSGPAANSSKVSRPTSSSVGSLDESEPDRRKKPFRVYDKLIGSDPRAFKFSLEEFGSELFTADAEGNISWKGRDVVAKAEALYIYDVDNDGHRDFCLVDTADDEYGCEYVYVYDLYNTRQSFSAYEARLFNYELTLEDDGLYLWQRYAYDRDSVVNRGKILHGRYKGIYVDWQRTMDIDGFGQFKVTDASGSGEQLTVYESGGAYHFYVDCVTTYFLYIDLGDLGTNYITRTPFSLTSNNGRVYIEGASMEENSQRYSLFFSEKAEVDIALDVGYSNISKRLVFHVSRMGKTTSLKSIMDLPYSNRISSMEVDVLSTAEELGAIRDLSVYKDKADIDDFLTFVDRPAYKVSVDDFQLLTDHSAYPTMREITLITTGGEITFRTISRFFQVGRYWYDIRGVIPFGQSDDRSFAFRRDKAKKVKFSSVSEDQSIVGTMDLSDSRFSLTGSLSVTERIQQARFTFKIYYQTFYVLSNNEFVANGGSVYEIFAGHNFMTLFQDE